MTERQRFDAQMRRLIGLKFVPASLDTHWEALQDVPLAVLTAAVTRAQKTRAEFPTPVELREDADQVAHLVSATSEEEPRGVRLAEPVTMAVPQAAAVLVMQQSWEYYDSVCSDTGWRVFWCGPFELSRKPWQEPRLCERRREHGAHEWVDRCACFDTNPALIRRRESQRKYAEKGKG